MNNVIILTTGLSGSSLLTSLLKQAGYWCGEGTAVKNNFSGHYDTFENVDLVDLNEQLFKELSIDFDVNELSQLPQYVIDPKWLADMDLSSYKQFIEKCQLHSPWVLKDPRLRFTLGFWLELINNHNCTFILIYRKPWNLWVSMLNKRQIISFKQLKNDERAMQHELLNLLASKNLTAQLMCFDDLLTQPKTEIAKLNKLLGSSLTADDLDLVLDPRLVTKSNSLLSQIKAVLIYIKNRLSIGI